MANILLGLMSHSSTHPCSWCRAHRDNLKSNGDPRTLGNITEQFWKFYQQNSSRTAAKRYDNVIHAPLLKGDADQRVVEVLPPPELHLLLGIVNKIYNEMFKVWDGASLWSKHCFVERSAIHGGSFDGNGCKRLLTRIDSLRAMCPLRCLRYVAVLDNFNLVVNSCFGVTLDPRFREHIAKFRDSYMALRIPVTPKVHAVFFSCWRILYLE